MLRLVVAVLITVVSVAFFMANTHPVAVSFVLGPPVPVRLIFLLLSAYALGVMTMLFYVMVRGVSARRKRKELARAVGRDVVVSQK